MNNTKNITKKINKGKIKVKLITNKKPITLKLIYRLHLDINNIIYIMYPMKFIFIKYELILYN